MGSLMGMAGGVGAGRERVDSPELPPPQTGPLYGAGPAVFPMAQQQPAPPPHYGTKPGHFETSKIHFPTSEGVSEVSERANE